MRGVNLDHRISWRTVAALALVAARVAGHEHHDDRIPEGEVISPDAIVSAVGCFEVAVWQCWPRAGGEGGPPWVDERRTKSCAGAEVAGEMKGLRLLAWAMRSGLLWH